MSSMKLRQSSSLERRLRRRITYHHASALRTNLIWMSGYIEVEGYVPPIPALHPVLGAIPVADLAYYRRDCKDFPPLARFTSQIAVPKVLTHSLFNAQIDLKTGEQIARTDLTKKQANLLYLNRVAIGFPTSSLTPWPRYYGYNAPEGQELNSTAREIGDNPNDWYISEKPVDVMLACEIWVSPTTDPVRLRRQTAYLNSVHRMVTLCWDAARRGERAFIPPSWMTEERAKEGAKRVFPGTRVEVGG